jgi:cytidine deaminase
VIAGPAEAGHYVRQVVNKWVGEWRFPERELIAAARQARRHARAAFSSFKVGAALETARWRDRDRLQYRERHLRPDDLRRARRDVSRRCRRAPPFPPRGNRCRYTGTTPPCGACRQILWEFGGDIEVVLANLRRQHGRYRLGDLLPLPFDARIL